MNLFTVDVICIRLNWILAKVETLSVNAETVLIIVFQTYREFFDIILKEIHNFGPTDVHPKLDLDESKVA